MLGGPHPESDCFNSVNKGSTSTRGTGINLAHCSSNLAHSKSRIGTYLVNAFTRNCDGLLASLFWPLEGIQQHHVAIFGSFRGLVRFIPVWSSLWHMSVLLLQSRVCPKQFHSQSKWESTTQIWLLRKVMWVMWVCFIKWGMCRHPKIISMFDIKRWAVEPCCCLWMPRCIDG